MLILTSFPFFFRVPAAGILCLFIAAPSGWSDVLPGDGRANGRAVWANDAVFDSDDQFSNGFGIGRNSALAASLDETGGTPAFGRCLAEWFLPERGDLLYREGWTLGHNMQNPDDIQERDLILDDVPYVSMLAWTHSHIAFNHREFTGFQTLIGWVGNHTFGEDLQRSGHKFFDANEPAGWDNQLDNEPLFNLYYMKKRKVVDRPRYDVSVNLDGALGNMFTFAQSALEFRIGDRPGGFAYQINTVGHALDYDARIHREDESYLYAVVTLRGRALLHALPRDGNLLRSGNTWTEQNELDTNTLIGQAGVSLHYERQHWGVHAILYFTSESVDNSGTDTHVADPQNNFAVLMFERFF